MRRHGIRALAGRRFRPCTTDSRHYLPVAPNLLRQEFVASAPNRVWLADITYIATGEGWLYLAAVLDLATRKIAGWSMRDHMRTELPLAALMMAAQRQRPAEGLICHSDRGSQYASEAYGRQLLAIKAKPSMSRTACCYDNAPMESFFHTLKVELVHQRRWATRGRQTRSVRVHRRLLQPAADPLCPWVQDPGTGRMTHGLNPCPPKRGPDQMACRKSGPDANYVSIRHIRCSSVLMRDSLTKVKAKPVLVAHKRQATIRGPANMHLRPIRLRQRLLPLAAFAYVAISGCATMTNRERESDLASAGFVDRPATTAERQTMLAKLPPHKFLRRVRGDRVNYVYADPTGCNCLYVGTQQAYGRYRRQQQRQNIADENAFAASDYADASWNWGAWGPFDGGLGGGWGPGFGW